MGRATHKLARLAAPLRPERAPYFVRLPAPPGLEGTFPAQGWYWVPTGRQVVTFLAPNFELAVVCLHELHAAAQQDPETAAERTGHDHR
jgi:hypothetical protein